MRYLLSFFIIILSTNLAFSTEDQITIGTKHKIYSETLNEEREIWIYLPPNHNPNGNYPVMYVLDGDRSFTYASGLVKQFAENDKMPSMILVVF
jgi:predicted alpha/beta superfamily hydrolase